MKFDEVKGEAVGMVRCLAKRMGFGVAYCRDDFGAARRGLYSSFTLGPPLVHQRGEPYRFGMTVFAEDFEVGDWRGVLLERFMDMVRDLIVWTLADPDKNSDFVRPEDLAGV